MGGQKHLFRARLSGDGQGKLMYRRVTAHWLQNLPIRAARLCQLPGQMDAGKPATGHEQWIDQPRPVRHLACRRNGSGQRLRFGKGRCADVTAGQQSRDPCRKRCNLGRQSARIRGLAMGHDQDRLFHE